MATMLGKVKSIIAIVKDGVNESDTAAEKAGSAPLRRTFTALNKSFKGTGATAFKGFLEALPSREHNALWKAIYHHVETLVTAFEESAGAVDGSGGFNPVGKRVTKVMEGKRTDPIPGTIVEIVEEAAAGPDALASEGESSDAAEQSAVLMCRVQYEDGSEETFPVEEAVSRINNDGEASERGEEDESNGGLSSEDVEALTSVANLAQAWVNYRPSSGSNKQHQLDVPAAMHATLGRMHDILLDLSGLDGLALQESIARVCEAMWAGERHGAELLVTQLVPYLLMASLNDEAREADVKRIFAVRTALLLMDFEDSSSEFLQGLLLRCFMHPKFLNTEIGRRFLVFLFSLQSEFIEDIHATIKNQVPHASPSVLGVYGDLYLKAWRESSGSHPGAAASAASSTNTFRSTVEACIQELMQASVLAGVSATHASLRAVLRPLHLSKHRPAGTAAGAEHDSMLSRLWEPILWRSTAVANPTARTQATRMLSDAFPLQTFASQKPAENDRANDALLQKQFDALRSLINDDDPRVRVAAAAATADVLTEYWEAIPTKISRALITHFITKLAADKTSSKVREAAVDGIGRLLDNPLSHSVLKAVLPSLRNMLHDRTERVRVSFIKLLQRVATVRGIVFYHIVPVDHLMARLAEDAQRKSVTSAMSKLLAPSFFPAIAAGADDDDGDDDGHADRASSAAVQLEEQHLSRAERMLRKNPEGTMAFYGAVKEHMDTQPLARLVVLLFNYARSVLASLPEADGTPTFDERVSEALQSLEAATADDNGNNNNGNDDDEDDEDEDEDGPETPDKRAKRKAPSRTKPKASTKQQQRPSKADLMRAARRNVAAELAADRRVVGDALQCAAVLWESLNEERGRRVCAETTDMLVATLGADESLPALYSNLVTAAAAHATDDGGNDDGGNDDDGNGDDASAASAALFAARSNALRLAACLDREDIPALAPMLLGSLSRVRSQAAIAEEFSLAVALLCKWGCVDEVAGLLQESVDASLCETTPQSQPPPPPQQQQPETLISEEEAAGGETKGKRKRKPSKKAAAAAAAAAAAQSEQAEQPMLDLSLTVKLLGFLAAGSDKMTRDARLSLLEDQLAMGAILKSLGAVKKVICRRLTDPSGISMLLPTTTPQASVLVEAVEVYARLLMHQVVVRTDENDQEEEEEEKDGDDKGGRQRFRDGRKTPKAHLDLCSAMHDLLAWARDDVLPIALSSAPEDDGGNDANADANAARPPAYVSSTAAAAASAAASDDFLLSPPAKSKRRAGTTPLHRHAGGGGGVGDAVLQERQVLAATVVARVLNVVGDWAHCCTGLGDLSAYAREVVRAINVSASSEAMPGIMHHAAAAAAFEDEVEHFGDLSFDVPAVVAVLLPLCRVAYQLAFREPEGAKLGKDTLKLLLRAAHLKVQPNGYANNDSDEEDDDDDDDEEDEETANGSLNGRGELALGRVNGAECSPSKCLKKLLVLAARRSRGNLSAITGVVMEHLLGQIACEQRLAAPASAQEKKPLVASKAARATLSTVLRSSAAVAKEFITQVLAAANGIAPPESLSLPGGERTEAENGGGGESMGVWLTRPPVVLLRAICHAPELKPDLLAWAWVEASSALPTSTAAEEVQAVGKIFNVVTAE